MELQLSSSNHSCNCLMVHTLCQRCWCTTTPPTHLEKRRPSTSLGSNPRFVSTTILLNHLSSHQTTQTITSLIHPQARVARHDGPQENHCLHHRVSEEPAISFRCAASTNPVSCSPVAHLAASATLSPLISTTVVRLNCYQSCHFCYTAEWGRPGCELMGMQAARSLAQPATRPFSRISPPRA